jgi:Trk K+ transport system NAD-binding subunit
VIGNAADLEVLKRAGIDRAPTVIITTHDDDMNVYLTVYCRRLRPDVQIIGRATAERNVRTLHRAGADIVMSYASMGASSIVNLLKRGKMLLLAEGLDILRVPIPQPLRGKTLAELLLPEKTGCAVVAVRTASGMEVTPDPHTPLPEIGELLLIGTSEAENRFLEIYGGPGEQDVPGLDEIAIAEA